MADQDYDRIIRAAVAAAAATGPLVMAPVPMVDAAAMTTIWASMLTAIAKKADHHLDSDTAGRVIVATTASVSSYWVGSKMFTWVVAKVPGVGMVAGSGVNSALNVSYTIFLGLSFIDIFEEEEFDILDFEYMTSYVTDAMKPYMAKRQIRRAMALIRRMRGSIEPDAPAYS